MDFHLSKNSIHCEKCYKVDLSSIEKNREVGVSGMMRVKNDAEFIEACIESCIEALDELIIVYNDCQDNSPIIIEKMRLKYPDKIKVYEYTPIIQAWNLTSKEIKNIFNGTTIAENTLAGYYNYALSKTTMRYVMKIDADQIYFTEKLIELCDAFRFKKKWYDISVISLIVVLYYNILLKTSNIIKSPFLLKLLSTNWWLFYYKNLIKVIKSTKHNISLHGINSYIKNDDIIVSLGNICEDGSRILPPFNGSGDHPIFKVTKKTFFIPYIDEAYNQLNKTPDSVIERLVGISPLFSGGLCWIHLNSYRQRIRSKMLGVIKNEFTDFATSKELCETILWERRFNKIFDINTKIISLFLMSNYKQIYRLKNLGINTKILSLIK